MESRTMFSEFRSDPEARPLSIPSGRIEIFSDTIAGFALPDCVGHPAWYEPREWMGAATDGAFHLLTDQPARKLHSQLDPSPHSVGGKVLGRKRVFMNPADAQRCGVSQHDVVELRNARGRCLASVETTGDLMEGVVRLSIGALYDPDETGRDRNGNPNVLTLDIGTSSLAQGCAAQTCLVEISGTITDARDPDPVRPPPFLEQETDKTRH